MSKTKSKAKKYLNGWRCIFTDPPPEHIRVLLTNNPFARDAHGGMSHIWIAFPIKDGREYVAFDEGNRKIQSIMAWHPMPGLPTPKAARR